MKKIGRIIGAAILVSGFAFSGWSQDAETPKNLLSDKWDPFGTEGKTIIQEDGVIACDNSTDKDASGVAQSVILNQKEAKAISFSAESKAENVSGNLDGANYAVYLDLRHPDGTTTWGVVSGFKTGTHDWEKVTLTFTPEKPIKSVSYCMLLRGGKTGKAWFRNAVLTEAPVKK